jgi:thiol:disulfide interchange protein
MPRHSLRPLSWHCFFVVLLASACAGCGSSGTDPVQDHLAGVDAQFLERHGQLTFVNNVEVGYKLAQERGMPCLFFFTAKWCTFCQRMATTAFPDAQVGQLGQNFVCVLVDADREQGVCQYFAVSGYPTVEFISPQGQPLHRLIGQQSPADLAAGMQAALGRFAWLSNSVVR